MLSKRVWISRRVIPRIAPFMKMFSRPVSSAWKPVPTSSRLATRPRSRIRPSVGGVIRESSFSSVLLPAPLRPTTPITSPSATVKEIPRSAQKCSGESLLAESRRPKRCASASRSVSWRIPPPRR